MTIMAVLRANIPSLSTTTRTCWLFISVIAALTEAADLLSRCPSQVPRNSYLKAAPWDKCYQFHMEERTWRNANHICASKGGHLVTIKEERVQSFLLLALAQYRWPRNGLWIGATDQENEMDWRWITGERVKDGYSKWASGQPSCGFFCFEDCAVMRWKEGGRWHDYRCNWLEDYSFICEYDMEPEPTTTPTTTTPTTTSTTTTTTSTTTTTTSTTTATTSTTAAPTTLKSLESEYLVHNHAHEEEEAINETTAILPPSVLLKGDSHAMVGQVQGHSTSSDNLGSGTMTALIVSILTTLAVGLCCLVFLLFRRRRRKQLAEQVGISYENPYYAETKTPLAAAANDDDDVAEDDGERFGACGGVGTRDEVPAKIAVEKSNKLKLPPPPSPLNSRPKCVMNNYDSPPSLSTHKPVTVAKATSGYKDVTKKDDDDLSLEEENHYDEIHSRQFPTHSTYDVPRSSSSHKYQDDHMENFYYNDEEEENLYESVDNLRAMVDQRRRQRMDDADQDQEEDTRYVPFALDSTESGQASKGGN